MNNTKAKTPTPPRWLEQDARKADPVFARQSDMELGTADLAVERYTSAAFHQLEMRKLWPRVWQMACHESEIPEPGNFTTYDIGKRSFIIVRIGSGRIKAYVNACLHRGMRLVEGQGKAAAFACSFHGWSWGLDGSNRKITEDWDFPQCKDKWMALPEALVATWGGFVFINPDQNAEPFESYIGELPLHFRNAPLENRKVAVHAARVIPANWKIAQEAFMESYHVSPTHPQSVAVSEYAETQYDLYPESPNISRLFTISIAPATAAMKALSQQEFGEIVSGGTWREQISVPPGQTFRNVLAHTRRDEVSALQGESVDHLTDSEMLDAIQYFLLPNFLPWYGFGVPIAYRFRPNGDRHDSCIMEVYVLAPRNLAEPMPPAPEILWIGEDEPFAKHECLGRLGPIFDQDYPNIVGVQKGLEATASTGVILSHYQERRIRHYHMRMDDYLNAE